MSLAPAPSCAEDSQASSSRPGNDTTVPLTSEQKIEAHIERAINLLHPPGAVFEVRVLNVRKPNGYTVSTMSGYYDNPAKAAKDAAKLSGQASGVYLTMNAIDPALLARCSNRMREIRKEPLTADKDVTRRRLVLIDCDCERPAGISATDGEVEAALAMAGRISSWLKAEGFPDPIRADSGNGAHLLLPIDLPNDDEGLVLRFLVGLGAKFDTDAVKVDTSVHNPARITKLYGTLAKKGDSTKDRKHRYAQITQEAEWIPTPRELLEKHAPAAKTNAAKPQNRARAATTDTFDVGDWMLRNIPDARGPDAWSDGPRKWVLPSCIGNPEHTSGEAFVIERSDGQIGAGCKHESCKWTWRELREHYEPGCYDKDRGEASDSEEVWSTPIPIGGGLSAVMPFDGEMLPESLRIWVMDIAHRMQCPPDSVAIAAMVMIGSAIGRALQIHPKRNDPWKQACNLWGGVVAPPGTLKSALVEAGLQPLRSLQAEKLREFQADSQKHEFERAVSGERIKARDLAIKAAIKDGGAASELEAIRKEHAEESEPPHPLRLEVNDTTTAKLGETLAQNPYGVLQYRDELIGLLSQLDRPGSEGDRQFLLECWNGNGSFIYDRIGRGTIAVEGLCLSIVGTLQPGPLDLYLRAAIGRGAGADGFLQRFQLLIYPDQIPAWKYVDKEPDHAAHDRVCAVVRNLVVIRDKLQGEIKAYHFAGDAQAIYAEWLTDLQQIRMRDLGETPEMVSHLSKFAGLVPKLALVLETCDAMASNRAIDSVGATSLARAILWTEYLETHARRIYGLVESGDESAGKQLLAKIRSGKLGDHFTRREVQRKGWAGLKEGAVVDAAIGKLVENGWLKVKTVNSSNRAFEKIVVHPDAIGPVS